MWSERSFVAFRPTSTIRLKSSCSALRGRQCYLSDWTVATSEPSLWDAEEKTSPQALASLELVVQEVLPKMADGSGRVGVFNMEKQVGPPTAAPHRQTLRGQDS